MLKWISSKLSCKLQQVETSDLVCGLINVLLYNLLDWPPLCLKCSVVMCNRYMDIYNRDFTQLSPPYSFCSTSFSGLFFLPVLLSPYLCVSSVFSTTSCIIHHAFLFLLFLRPFASFISIMPFLDLKSRLGVGLDRWLLLQSGEQPNKRAARCHAFEKEWVECSHGIGKTRATKECQLEFEDFYECMHRQKTVSVWVWTLWLLCSVGSFWSMRYFWIMFSAGYCLRS